MQAKASGLDLRTAEARRAGGWANTISPKLQTGQFFSNLTTRFPFSLVNWNKWICVIIYVPLWQPSVEVEQQSKGA